MEKRTDAVSAGAEGIGCTETVLERWIDTYDKLIFSICYKLTGDYFAAEDLAQETFLTAYQKYAFFDGANEKAWICRIATNKSIDYLRSAERRAMPAQDTFFEMTGEETKESPEEICMEREIRQNLSEKCSMLKPPYNEVAMEYYINELTPREIAEKRKENLKTVQTRIYRAREMLKRLYRKEEPA